MRAANLASPDDLARLRRRPRQQPERHFTDRVKRYAKRGGWLAFHNLHAKGSDPGFPDLHLMRGQRIVIAELKVPPNSRPSDWQQVWLNWWSCLGLLAGPHLTIETYVWQPSDWTKIEALLR